MTADIAPPAFSMPAALVSGGFALRPETGDDIAFLSALFASTREDELALVPWTPEQKQAFLAGQFKAQRHHYRTYNADCAFGVITHRDQPIGRLYLECGRRRIHIVDIALMPDWRAQGIGTAILYDHFTPFVLPQLEAFGFCGRGEAKDFVRAGQHARGGRLPINTNGGQLGEAYIHGMNGIAEGVRQVRGTSVNQVADPRHVLVTAGTGVPTSGLVLGPADAL